MNRVSILVGGLVLTASSFAAGLPDKVITNNLTSVSAQNLMLCYNASDSTYNYNSGNVAMGESFSLPASKFSNFNVREGGCDYSNTYIGNLTITHSHKGQLSVDDYSYNEDMFVKLSQLAISNSGSLMGKMAYLPPDAVKLPEAKTRQSTWQYIGVNLSGSEFGKTWNPINSPKAAEMAPFIEAGMNTFRFPIRWAYLQPEGPGKGALDENYLAFMKRFVSNATQYKAYVIIDMHNYMRYSKIGEEVAGVPAGGSTPQGTLVQDANQMVDVWEKLVTTLRADKSIDQDYVIFDLSNEPTDMKEIGGTETALEYQNAIIAGIRSLGADNLLLVEGNHWTGLHSWPEAGDGTTANSEVFTRDSIVDPKDNYAINVHQYFDADHSGTHRDCQADLSEVNMDKFVQYLQDNKMKAIVTEFGTGRGENCMSVFEQFLSAMKKHAYTDKKGYGFIGWTAWAAGHGWGGSANYELYIDADAPQMEVMKKFL